MASKILNPETYATRTAIGFTALGLFPAAMATEFYFLGGYPFGKERAAKELGNMKDELTVLKQAKEEAPNDTISMEITSMAKTNYDYATGHAVIASDTAATDTVLVTHTGQITAQEQKIADHKANPTFKDFGYGVGGAIMVFLLGYGAANLFKENLGALRAKIGGNDHMQEAFAKRAERRQKRRQTPYPAT
jgi:hypothetical protein